MRRRGEGCIQSGSGHECRYCGLQRSTVKNGFDMERFGSVFELNSRTIAWGAVCVAAAGVTAIWIHGRTSSAEVVAVDAGTQASAPVALQETSVPARPSPWPASSPAPTPAGQAASSTAAHAIAVPSLLGRPFAKIYADALAARDPKDRALAFQLASFCLGAANYRQPVEVGDVMSNPAGSGQDPERLKTEVNEARAQMLRECDTVNTEEWMDAFRKLPMPRLDRTRIDLEGGVATSRPQAHYQAMTQVLSNPEAFPVPFGLWLENDLRPLLAREFQASARQSYWVQDELIRTFVKDQGVATLMRNRRCAISYACDSNAAMTAEELQRAQALAQLVEDRIRRQQWAQLSQ